MRSTLSLIQAWWGGGGKVFPPGRLAEDSIELTTWSTSPQTHRIGKTTHGPAPGSP